MIWRNHSNRVLNVLINNVNMLSEKARNALLSIPNVASQDCFNNKIAL